MVGPAAQWCRAEYRAGGPGRRITRLALVNALVLLIISGGCTRSGYEMQIANETERVILVSVGEDGDPIRVEGDTSVALRLPDGCARDRTLRVGVVARTEDGKLLAREAAPCGVRGPRWVFHADGTADLETQGPPVDDE